MAERTSKIKVSLLDNKINILKDEAADAPPGTQQVMRTVINGILTLVRDKMIADKYSVQLSDYCFGVCEVVKNLDESVSIELEDLGRVFGEIARTIRRGSNVPRLEYDKDKIEGHKSEIQKILSALNAPTSSSPKDSAVVPLPDELVAQRPPIVSSDPTAASASQSVLAIRRLIGRDFLPDQLPYLIETICICKNSNDTIRSLTRDDAQTFIEVVDEALDRPDLSPSVRKQCLRPLYKTCGRHALLPTSLKIPICYDQISDALYSGGYADVWKGEHCGRDVAVKVIRRHSKSDLAKLVGKFCKEVVTWRTLHHPNVLGLIGVTMTETKFAMISDWMANGNIREFLEENRGANRLKLLEDVATGLIYLHSQGMIHGDLKGANVLIDNTGNARLADFGLLKIISDPANPSSSSSCTQCGSTRWMSPELIDPGWFKLKISRPTKSSDCYALGMVIYETITDKVPFHQDSTFTASRRVLAGEHPPRGESFTNCLWLWKTLEECWKFQPDERPCIEDVHQCLKESSDLPVPLFPKLDTEVDRHGGDSDSTNSLSGDLNPNADVRVTERAAASPGLGHLISRQVCKAHVDSVGPEATTANSQTRPIDSSIGGIRQDPLTTIGVVKIAGQPGSNTRTPDPYQGSETTILDGTTEKNDKLREEGTSHDTFERIYQRLAENIEKYAPNPQEQKFLGICIPQRLYCQGTSIRVGEVSQKILFAMDDGPCFPAELALAGRSHLLVDRDSAVLTPGHTINVRIEWPGYNGWAAQLRTLDWQNPPKSITRAKLATDIAKLLHKFIEMKKSVSIDPAYEIFRVGPGGIELRHIGIASLDRVSRGSWQPTLIYNGLEEV